MNKFIFLIKKISDYFGMKDLLKINSNILIELLMKKERYQNNKSLTKYGYSVFSQGDEDGIIEQIFSRIKVQDKKFIELGVENGTENNTTNLLLNNWTGLWVEGNQKFKKDINKNFQNIIYENKLKVEYTIVNSDNINNLLSKHFSENQTVDFLSIDISLHTYHVLKSINFIRPRVICVEYNAKMGPKNLWIAENNNKLSWKGDMHYGASLKSYEEMLKNKGYSLVGCSLTGVNAFFIDDNENLDLFNQPFTSENHYEEEKIYLIKYFSSYHQKKFGDFLNK